MTVNAGRTRDDTMQACLRELCFVSAVHQFKVRCVHVAGVNNRLPDLLSRWMLSDKVRKEFREVTAGKDMHEVSCPESLFQFAHSW